MWFWGKNISPRGSSSYSALKVRVYLTHPGARKPMEAGIEWMKEMKNNSKWGQRVGMEHGQIKEGLGSQGKDFGFDFKW